MVHMWRCEDNLQESTLFYYHVGSESWTLAVQLLNIFNQRAISPAPILTALGHSSNSTDFNYNWKKNTSTLNYKSHHDMFLKAFK